MTPNITHNTNTQQSLTSTDSSFGDRILPCLTTLNMQKWSEMLVHVINCT